MVRVLKRTAARCAHISKTYSIGRSFDGRDLLVIEFSSRPGQHELSKPLPLLVGVGQGEWSGLGEGTGPLGLGAHEPVPGPNQSPPCLGDGVGGDLGLAGGTGVLATSHQACVPTATATLGVGEEAARRVMALWVWAAGVAGLEVRGVR